MSWRDVQRRWIGDHHAHRMTTDRSARCSCERRRRLAARQPRWTLDQVLAWPSPAPRESRHVRPGLPRDAWSPGADQHRSARALRSARESSATGGKSASFKTRWAFRT